MCSFSCKYWHTVWCNCEFQWEVISLACLVRKHLAGLQKCCFQHSKGLFPIASWNSYISSSPLTRNNWLIWLSKSKHLQINSATESTTFAPQSLKPEADSSAELGSQWSYIKEPIGISKDDAFLKPGLLEQINTTADKSDYLWYSLR